MYHLAGWHLFKHVHKYVKETMYYCSTMKLIKFHLLDFLILNMVSIIRSSNNTLTHIHNHLNRHITNTHKHTHTHTPIISTPQSNVPAATLSLQRYCRSECRRHRCRYCPDSVCMYYYHGVYVLCYASWCGGTCFRFGFRVSRDSLELVSTTNDDSQPQGMLEEGRVVTVRGLLKGLYEKACQQKLWGLVRHTAGMLGKRVEDLAKAVTDLLVRQKQVGGLGGMDVF